MSPLVELVELEVLEDDEGVAVLAGLQGETNTCLQSMWFKWMI